MPFTQLHSFLSINVGRALLGPLTKCKKENKKQLLHYPGPNVPPSLHCRSNRTSSILQLCYFFNSPLGCDMMAGL